MILGFSSPSYTSLLPERKPLLWLLEHCSELGLGALEASLPLEGKDDPREVGKAAADLGIRWIGYWCEDFVTPEGGVNGLLGRAQKAFDVATNGGVKSLVIFGQTKMHNRFTNEPPLVDQLKQMTDHLGPVAEAASDREIQLGLLPHLDYRGKELVSVMEAVDHSHLGMAFDTANALPVCEDPVDAARSVLPHAIAVAFKDARVYPGRSNQVTIWGTPIGQGSVDFETILRMMAEQLPDPDGTTVAIKLRLPPDSQEHEVWMEQSLAFLRSRVR